MRLGKVAFCPSGCCIDIFIFFVMKPNTGNGISFNVQRGEFLDGVSHFALVVIFYFFVENKFDLSHY